ncbi:MAG: T9SS C-terminal target domain-containing protein [Calditrichaeota bacterium]|nr:MAG: T9SS C-terminal target domain-containing protein [Calditrichota bacterium]
MKKVCYKFLFTLVIFTICGFTTTMQAAEQPVIVKLLKTSFAEADHLDIQIPAKAQRIYDHFLKENRDSNQRTLGKKTYNVAGTIIIETVTQYWVNGAWVNAYKDIEVYDEANLTVLLSYEGYFWENGAWLKEATTTFSYANGLLMEMLLRILENGVWYDFMKMTNEYSGNTLIYIYTEMDLMATGTLEYVSKNELYYDGNKFLIKQENYNWAGTEWTEYSEITYTNNAQGQLLEEVLEIVAGGMSFPSEKILYTYTAMGYSATTTRQNYDIVSSSWMNMDKLTNTYNGSGQLIEELFQDWAGAVWLNIHLIRSLYSGDQTSEILYLFWSGSAWENDSRDTYTWSGGVLVQILVELWLNGAWENDERYLISAPATSVSEEEIIPADFTLSNYPNPFNPETTINYSLPHDAAITLVIFDTQGRIISKLISRRFTEAGSHNIQWNGRNDEGNRVSSGVYFYRLYGAGFTKTGQCLLLK